MPNVVRKRSEYKYEIPEKLTRTLLAMVLSKDRSLEELIIEALDQYIEREKK